MAVLRFIKYNLQVYGASASLPQNQSIHTLFLSYKSQLLVRTQLLYGRSRQNIKTRKQENHHCDTPDCPHFLAEGYIRLVKFLVKGGLRVSARLKLAHLAMAN